MMMMVNLSLASSLLPQKPTCRCGDPGIHLVGKEWYCTECFINGDDETEKEHDPFGYLSNIRNNFRDYLRHIMLHCERWLGVA